MEVGAVKQAFNNEIILLKKNLSQAKTQIINKLTRKAKTITDKKKAPDHLKEKMKKKAESAVREVLIIKKIKPKELGKFIVTHKGQLQQYLNRPQVDQDKACARLLLHKALQEKYKTIRNRFSDVPIKDLFMSRQERLKLKKEAREEKKNKKNKKGGKVVNAQGDWDVEDLKIGNDGVDGTEISKNNKEHIFSDESAGHASEGDENSEDHEESNVEESEDNEEPDTDEDQDVDDSVKEEDKIESDDNCEKGKFLKLSPVRVAKNKIKEVENKTKKNILGKDIEMKFKVIEEEIKKKQNKKPKDANKNKNLNEKLISRKFKKDPDEITVKESKVVDPFFITSSGENYLSVAEPRQPDEVKEIHKQGNRQMRRAAMFGHVPKRKPRTNFYENNDRYNSHNSYGNREDNRYEKQNGFQKDRFKDNKDNDFKNNRFNRQDSDGGQKRNFKDRNSQFRPVQEESKPEKLHPSWEAKKKQSGILPFQGKKIVFSDD